MTDGDLEHLVDEGDSPRKQKKQKAIILHQLTPATTQS